MMKNADDRIKNAAKAAASGILFPEERLELVGMLSFYYGTIEEGGFSLRCPDAEELPDPEIAGKMETVFMRLSGALNAFCREHGLQVERREIDRAARAAAAATTLPALEPLSEAAGGYADAVLSGLCGPLDPLDDPDGLDRIIPIFELLEKESGQLIGHYLGLLDLIPLKFPTPAVFRDLERQIQTLSDRTDEVIRLAEKAERRIREKEEAEAKAAGGEGAEEEREGEKKEKSYMSLFLDPFNGTVQLGCAGRGSWMRTLGFKSPEELEEILRDREAATCFDGEKPGRARVALYRGGAEPFPAEKVLYRFLKESGFEVEWITPEEAVCHGFSSSGMEYLVGCGSGPAAVILFENRGVRVGFDGEPGAAHGGLFFTEGSERLAELFIEYVRSRKPGELPSREDALHFLALGEWSAAHLPDDEESLALWHEAAGSARKAYLERLASAVIEEPGLAERICDASHILLGGTFLPLFLDPAEEDEYDVGWEDEEEDPYAEDDLGRPIWEFFFNPLAKSVGQGPYFAVPVYQVDRPGFEVTDGIRTAPENAWRPFFSLFEVK